MRASEKDRLAAEVADRWVAFEIALSDKRKYPVQQLRQFWGVGRRYAELTKRDPLIHRSVANAVNGVTDFVMAERKRVPEQVVRDAQRLESLVFDGYDSYFEGSEPPGLSTDAGGFAAEHLISAKPFLAIVRMADHPGAVQLHFTAWSRAASDLHRARCELDCGLKMLPKKCLGRCFLPAAT